MKQLASFLFQINQSSTVGCYLVYLRSFFTLTQAGVYFLDLHEGQSRMVSLRKHRILALWRKGHTPQTQRTTHLRSSFAADWTCDSLVVDVLSDLSIFLTFQGALAYFQPQCLHFWV